MAPLADMRAWSQEKTMATQRLARRARQDGVDVLDLYPVLMDTRGTYLNLDGHWSQIGVDMVAQQLVKAITPAR